MLDDVRDLYQDTILAHARNPANLRALDHADATAEGHNPLCGDTCAVSVRFAPDHTAEDIAFAGRGCAIMLASADLMANAARHRAPAEIHALAEAFETLLRTGTAPDDADLTCLLPFSGISEYPSRIKCATLPWAALRAALDGEMEASSE